LWLRGEVSRGRNIIPFLSVKEGQEVRKEGLERKERKKKTKKRKEKKENPGEEFQGGHTTESEISPSPNVSARLTIYGCKRTVKILDNRIVQLFTIRPL
jgi:hypothetical protein